MHAVSDREFAGGEINDKDIEVILLRRRVSDDDLPWPDGGELYAEHGRISFCETLVTTYQTTRCLQQNMNVHHSESVNLHRTIPDYTFWLSAN